MADREMRLSPLGGIRNGGLSDGIAAPYRRVHVVINSCRGKDEPILNVLNDVFRQHGVTWDVSITHGYWGCDRTGESCDR